MNTWVNLFILPVILGLVGAITPCAMGINALLLGYLMDKERRIRLWQGAQFTLVRAGLLTLLGLLFGLLGQTAAGFIFAYQKVIAVSLILLGVLFIVSGYRPLPIPELGLARRFGRGPGGALRRAQGGALTLGILFGLDIPACTGALVLALLARTVLMGNYVAGAISLFVFGVAMSLPVLVVVMFEGANRALVGFSRRARTAFYFGAGGVLILVGAGELSPRVIAFTSSWLDWLSPFLPL